MKTKSFRLIARSSNTNSFGLRGHVFMARDGQAFEVARPDGDHHARQFEVGKDYEFPVLSAKLGNRPATAADSFELYRRLRFAPDRVVKSVFKDAALLNA